MGRRRWKGVVGKNNKDKSEVAEKFLRERNRKERKKV